MIRAGEATASAISRGFDFFTRQDRDWKVSVIRSNSAMFFYRMVLPYISVYIMALGATGTELGIINSAGMGAAGIAGLLGGWLVDRIGVKKV